MSLQFESLLLFAFLFGLSNAQYGYYGNGYNYNSTSRNSALFYIIIPIVAFIFLLFAFSWHRRRKLQRNRLESETYGYSTNNNSSMGNYRGTGITNGGKGRWFNWKPQGQKLDSPPPMTQTNLYSPPNYPPPVFTK